MKPGLSEAIDALRVKEPSAPRPVNSLDILVSLAVRFDLDVEQLLEEISAPTALAKIARGLLDLHDLKKPSRKRGGQPKDEKNWRMFNFVLRQRIADPTVSMQAIARDWVSETGGENPRNSRENTTVKQLGRLTDRWSDLSSLTVLMLGRPPD